MRGVLNLPYDFEGVWKVTGELEVSRNNHMVSSVA